MASEAENARKDVGSSEIAGQTSSQVIRGLLKVDPTQTSAQAQLALMALEVRPLPSGLAVDELDHTRLAGSSSCFSLCSPGAWASHSMCQRCRLINQLVQTENVNKAIAKAHIAIAILTTDCEGQDKRKGEVPRLSQELLDLIVDFAIEELNDTGNRKAVCKLMHTSRALRLRAIKAFPPISVFEEQYEGWDQEHSICFTRLFCNFLWDAALWWLKYASLKKYADAPLPPESLHNLRTMKRGLEVIGIRFDIVIDDAELGSSSAPGGNESVKGKIRYVLDDDDVYEPLDERDLAQMITRSLRRAAPPKAVHAYYRALRGCLVEDVVDVSIEFRLCAYLTRGGVNVHKDNFSFQSDSVQVYQRCWRYQTSRYDNS